MHSKHNLLYQNELKLAKKYTLIAGVDEAGRGPIAGPVVIAAVILNHKLHIDGINDSKKLSHKQREALFPLIIANAVAYSIIEVSHQRIDDINILQAVLEGMKLSVESLSKKPKLCLIDGDKLPVGLNMETKAVIKGDSLYASIAAASILAKVTRDRIMTGHDVTYPAYGFAQHKGYPTQQHLKALQVNGPCPIHRMTYAPVRQLEIWQR